MLRSQPYIKVFLATVAALGATGAQAQAGFPGSLRRPSDRGTVPFRAGTAITLRGGPSRYPLNGYQPGLLTGTSGTRPIRRWSGVSSTRLRAATRPR